MTAPRLTSALQVSALLRRIDRAGGFGAVLAKGDPTAGAMALVLRGSATEPVLVTRSLGASGTYVWTESARGDMVDAWCDRARSRDPDLWIVELDIPDAARFVAEMSAG